MAASPRTRVPYSRGDKFLFVMLGIVTGLVAGISLWLYILDTDPVVAVPTPKMPVPNARDYFIEAANGVVDTKKIIRVNWQPIKQTKMAGVPGQRYSSVQKEALVTENSAALLTFRAGLPYHYQELPLRSFNAYPIHYDLLSALAHLIALQAQVKAARGDWAGTMSADLDLLHMGEEIPHGQAFNGLRIGLECQTLRRRQTLVAINYLSLPETHACIRRLERIGTRHVRQTNALQEEKSATQRRLMELMQRRDWAGQLLSALDSDHREIGNPLQWCLNTTRIRITGKRRIMSNYSAYMDQAIANAAQPYARHLGEPSEPTDVYTPGILPNFSDIRLSEVNANTQNALLLALLALHAYKLEHRVYPMTLSVLVPRYLRAVPMDPFALFGPLKYKREAAKFVLYSVGPDGKDDNGTAIYDLTKSAPPATTQVNPRRDINEDSKGDIVAGVNIY